MSKGRKISKVATDVSWDVGLVNDLVDDDTWRSCLVFLSPDHVSTQPHLEALVTAADGGNRRRFAIIDRETLLQSAREDAKLASTAGGGGKKSKQSSAAPGDRPQHVEVCEHVVNALSSGGGVPAPLVARMLKYKVLRKRSLDLARKEAIRKEAEETMKPQKPASDTKGGKKAAGSGRTSKAAGGKKDAQAVDVSPAVPMPQKPPTSMKKRGEEDLDSKYIDDEPKDGPDCYFLLTGFASAEIFQHLSPVKLTAHALVQVVGQEPLPPPEQGTLTEEEQLELQQRESSLFQFWSCIRHVIKATPSGSMLRDTAQLELTVTQSAVPSSEEEKAVYAQSLFDILAQQVFHMLQQYKQYHHYINYLDVQPLPLMASEQPEEARPISSSARSQKGSPSVNMRYYRELLSAVPEECSSIPLIVHCMVEQVSTTLSTTGPAQDSQNPDPMIHPAIMAEVDSCISSLAIPSADKKELVTDEDKLKQLSPSKASCTIIAHSDSSKQRTFHLKDSKILKISEAETTINHLSSTSELFNAPVLPRKEMLKQSVKRHALEHFCVSAELSPRMLDYALVVLSLEHTQLPNASQPQNLSSITHNGGFELLFDYPYSIPLKEISQSEALVPYSAMESAEVATHGVSVTPQCTLDLPLPLVSLEDYAVCEYLTKDVLLQLLQNLQSTHPYVKHFYHRHSKSVVVIAHTGFDGNPIHEYQLVSQAHSKVGFHNYLQFAAGTYGNLVDKGVLEDAENRKQMEEQRQLLVEEKLKTIKEDIQTPPKEEPTRLSGKSSKRDNTTSSAKKTPSASGKKSMAASKECTPAASTLDVVPSEVSLPEIKERKLFLAYDVGDKVLLNKSSVSTQFTADGAQIRTEKLQPVESPTSIKVSLLDNDHSLSIHVKLKEKEDTPSVNETEVASERKEGGEDNESESQEVVQPVAGTPQPPQSVSFASLQASFQKGLTLTLSHYGPNGNGELPFEPEKPLALQQPSRAQSSSSSRPQSQQSTSPQKMSKKQQEQMQQQLEQQKLLEEQQARERKVLEKKYQQERTAILRHNKYQQLFASTSYGLHTHCQVMVDLEADPSLTDGSDGYIVVRQSYPVKGNGTQKCEEVLLQAALIERKRCYLPDGSVVRFMLDKSVVILCADGSVYRTASLSETELYKNTIPTDQALQGDQTSQIALEVSERVLSAAKVTFADEQDIAIEETGHQAIWVVTTPTGEQYLWKKEDVPTNKDELVEEKDEGQTDEDHVATESTDAPAVSVIVPLTPIQTFPATDPVTKEVLITREDNVILLYHPTGSHVVEHADGTRFTTHWSDEVSNKIPSEVVIECAGFARVIYYQSQRQCKVDFPDHSKILCSTDGSYIISKPNDYTLHIAPNGEAKYTPGFQQEIEQQSSSSGTYTLNHTGCSDILVTHDTLGNQFSVSAAGEISVLPSSTDMKVPPHAAFTPRYFVLQEDGTCYEMVQSKTAEAVITAAESDRKAIVIRDTQFSEPNSTSTTIIEPYEVGSNSLPYIEESIVPENLRTVALSCQAGGEQKQNGCTHKRKFGVGVGKALMIGSYHKPPPQTPFIQPKALKYRQFVHVRPVGGETRKEVYSGLTRYLTWRREQEEGGEDLQPVDERTDSEKQVARELQSRWNQDISDKMNMSDSELSSKYVQLAIQQPSCEVVRSSERAGMKAKHSEGIKKELEDTEAAKIALREHKVMPYFESMEYLRAKSPDMEELASKLAKPKQPTDVASTEALVSKQAHSSCSTPSTLHSASMTLPPGGEVASPVPSEATGQLGPVGSLSKLRPSNPTPDHAHGNSTPTDIRPTNPTPSHALKAAPVNTTEEISVSTSTEDVQTSLTTSTNVTMDMTTSSTEDAAPTRPENPTPVEAYLGPSQRPTSQSSFVLPQPSSSVGNTVSFTLPQPESDHDQENSIKIASSQEEVTKGFSKPHGSPLYISTYTDVTGKTRTMPVKAPSSIQGGRPGEQCNIKFATVEDPVRRKVHSSSITSTANVVRGFDVLPERVEFGVLKEGCTYASTVTLKNTGIDSCRFKIKQPPPSTGIKVIYIPGPVAAGLSRSFDVEIFAMAVGVVGECGEGCVEHDLEIVTETSILHLPIKATVLTGAAYEGHPSEDREAPGVRVIADRPLSRESLTRPPKTL